MYPFCFRYSPFFSEVNVITRSFQDSTIELDSDLCQKLWRDTPIANKLSSHLFNRHHCVTSFDKEHLGFCLLQCSHIFIMINLVTVHHHSYTSEIIWCQGWGPEHAYSYCHAYILFLSHIPTPLSVAV